MHTSNSFKVIFFEAVIDQIWDMPDNVHLIRDGSWKNSKGCNCDSYFNFILQDGGPYYVSTFTNYDMTGLTSTTFEVRFSNYDTNKFVTETDVATDTYKLKFD